MDSWRRRFLPLVGAIAVLAIGACAPGAPPLPKPEPAPPAPAAPQPAPAKPAEPAPKPAEPAPAAKPERDLREYFDGREVRIIVGASPGGGYDVFARLFARFAADHMDGNPRFVVENVPGAGQLLGLQTTMRSNPDGYTMGLLHPRFVQREIVGIEVPDFDLDTVLIIGSPSGGMKMPRLWCTRRDVATSWGEVVGLGRSITNGAVAPGGPFGLGPQFVETIGGPVHMVYGYGGTSEVMAAFDRGEVESTDRCTEENVPRLFPEWLEEGILAPIFWWENEVPREWLEELGVAEVPHLLDVVEATESQEQAFEVAVELATTDRIFVLPPGVPDDIYQAWQQIFESVMQDPRFIEAAQEGGHEVGPATPEQIRRVIEMGQALSEEGKELLQELSGE